MLTVLITLSSSLTAVASIRSLLVLLSFSLFMDFPPGAIYTSITVSYVHKQQHTREHTA